MPHLAAGNSRQNSTSNTNDCRSSRLAWLVRLEFALMFSLLHASSIAMASDTDMVMVVSLFKFNPITLRLVFILSTASRFD